MSWVMHPSLQDAGWYSLLALQGVSRHQCSPWLDEHSVVTLTYLSQAAETPLLLAPRVVYGCTPQHLQCSVPPLFSGPTTQHPSSAFLVVELADKPFI